jgi:hypothetical protein
MNARDTKMLRRLVDYYGDKDVLREIAKIMDSRAAEYKEAGNTIPQRWHERAAKMYRLRSLDITNGIDGHKEYQPEFDHIDEILSSVGKVNHD